MELSERYLIKEKNRILRKYGCKTIDEALISLENLLKERDLA